MSDRSNPDKSKAGRNGGYYPRQSAPRVPPQKPTPPSTRTIKEGTREPGEPSLAQTMFGKRGS